MRGRTDIEQKINRIGLHNCYISEITKAELIYGAECSNNREANLALVHAFCEYFSILPISNVIDEYAKQKSRLRRLGLQIEDADLFIGCTAKVYDLVMATENIKHLGRIEGIVIENWADSATNKH